MFLTKDHKEKIFSQSKNLMISYIVHLSNRSGKLKTDSTINTHPYTGIKAIGFLNKGSIHNRT